MILSFSMFYNAWKKAVKQSSIEPKDERLKYELEESLIKLLIDLEEDSFNPDSLKTMIVTIPKKRVVQTPSTIDKIVQNVLCDNYLTEALSKPLIKETSACISNRGTKYASDLLKTQLRNYYSHYGSSFYVLKCDIKSYFASIEHLPLSIVLERYVFDGMVAKQIKQFVDLMPVGLALGLRQSQLIANLYLSSLDHYCKEQLHAKYYGRYMDDFYIISNDKAYLNYCLNKINTFVEKKLTLKLNPKTKIYKNTLPYIGFVYYLDSKGKAVQRLASDKKKTKKRHIRKMMTQVANGELSIEKFVNSYMCWRAHALQGDCYKLIMEWDQWVKSFINEHGYTWKIKGNKVALYVKNN